MKNKGNATIEYLLFIPVFTMTLLLLIYFGLQMVRLAAMQQAVEETAEALARIWMTDDNEQIGDMLQNGSFSKAYITCRERYWWLNSILLSGGKIREAEKQLQLRLESQSLFGESITDGKTDFIPNIRYTPDFNGGILNVYLLWNDKTVFGNLLAHFGMQNQSVLSVHAYSRIADPREFINNTDYVLQYLQKTKIGQSAIANFIEPIQNSIRKLSEE